MRRHPVRQVEHHFVDEAPAPAFGRIIALDDRMLGRVEMLGRVLARRLIAAADMAAGAADAQVEPGVARFETFFAAKGAGRHLSDRM